MRSMGTRRENLQKNIGERRCVVCLYHRVASATGEVITGIAYSQICIQQVAMLCATKAVQTTDGYIWGYHRVRSCELVCVSWCALVCVAQNKRKGIDVCEAD